MSILIPLILIIIIVGCVVFYLLNPTSSLIPQFIQNIIHPYSSSSSPVSSSSPSILYTFNLLGKTDLTQAAKSFANTDTTWIWVWETNLSCVTTRADDDGDGSVIVNSCKIDDILKYYVGHDSNYTATHLNLNGMIYSINDKYLVNSYNKQITNLDSYPRVSRGTILEYGTLIETSGFTVHALTLDNSPKSNYFTIANGLPISTWNVPNPKGQYIKCDGLGSSYLFLVFSVGDYNWYGYFVNSNDNSRCDSPFPPSGHTLIGKFFIGTFS